MRYFIGRCGPREILGELAFVPAIGYQKDLVGYDVAVLGVAGSLFLVGSEV